MKEIRFLDYILILVRNCIRKVAFNAKNNHFLNRLGKSFFLKNEELINLKISPRGKDTNRQLSIQHRILLLLKTKTINRLLRPSPGLLLCL